MLYFWRVMFTYMIAFHHLLNIYGLGVGWYIGVDFFAILSGFLLCHHIERHPQESVFEYAKGRFVYFAPIVFLCAVATLYLQALYRNINFSETGIWIIQAIPEYLLLNAYSISRTINGVDWYIQALVIPSIFLAYLYRWNKVAVASVLAPIVAWLIYSVLLKNYGHAEGYMVRKKVIDGLINWSVLRVFAGLCLGAFCYYIKNCFKIRIKGWLQVVPLLIFVCVFLLSYLYGKSRYDMVYILLCGLGLVLAAATSSNALFYNKFILFLSKISIYIYLLHMPFHFIMKKFIPEFSVWVCVTYLVLITVTSLMMHLLIEILKKLATQLSRSKLERFK